MRPATIGAVVVLGLALSGSPALAQKPAASSSGSPSECETVQADRLVAGGPIRQSHEVELLRCGDVYRMRLVKVSPGTPRQTVAEQTIGKPPAGATVELAGGACLLAGKPVLENLVIHGRWGKQQRITFGAGLLGAWIPDAAAGRIRAIEAPQKLVCQTDRP